MEPGQIVLSPKAASDLGAGPGDTVQLRHPRRTGPTRFIMGDSTVRVSGVTMNPMRPIAFNSTSIATEERRREHATMFAFGLPLRRVLRIIATETFVIGLVATAFGTGLGCLLLRWITQSTVASTSPDLAIDRYVATGTLVIAVIVGVGAVTLAPLLPVRKLRHMDISSTLRVLE